MSFAVRVRGPNGQTTLSVDPSMTVSDLLHALSSAAGISSESLSIKSGFPPKTITIPQDQSSNAASALGLSRGDTLIVASDGPSQMNPSSSSQAPFHAVSSAAAASSSSVKTTSRLSATNASTGPAQVKNTSVPAPEYGGSLVIRVAPDDNSCLFHALGLLLLPGEPLAPAILRKQVAQTIKEHPDEYSDAILGMPRDQYMATIQKESSWGGSIELAIISKAYQCEVDAIDIQSSRIDKYGQGEYSNRALLLYSGIHYDSAVVNPDALDLEDFDTRLFATQDGDNILKHLKALADVLREKHYYTDTANFTLKCEVCKKGLVGQKEAQGHAIETGHASFGEC